MPPFTKLLPWHLTASGLVVVAVATTKSNGSAMPSLSHAHHQRQIIHLPPQLRWTRRRGEGVQTGKNNELPHHARRRQLNTLKTLSDVDAGWYNSTLQLPLPANVMLPQLPPSLLDTSRGNDNEVGGIISSTYPATTTTISIQPRIINGLPTSPNRYPYVSSLLQTSEMKHMCGGTLIAPDIILTAGHCSGFFDSIQVGKYDIINQQAGTFDHLIVEKHMAHPGFSNVIMNDFALAKLYGTSSVQPIRINNRRNLPVVGEILSVMGWGVTVEGDSDTASEVLRSINVSALSNDACNNSSGIYEGKSVSLAGYIVDNMLCAWNPDHDACQGDSGGPLIETESSTQEDVQVGIVSWGLGCANTFPGVYARISSEYSWIRETVCADSVSPPSYFVCDGGVVSTSGWEMATSEVTIAIELDGAPGDTSFVLEEDPESVIIMGRTALIDGVSQVPFDTFTATQSTVERVVLVAPNKQYRLTLLDRGMNGIQPQSGQDRQARFRMCHGNLSGDECINAEIDSGAVICNGSGDFDLSRSIYCFVEQIGTLPPSPSPTGIKKPPTYAPLVLPIMDDDRLPTGSPSLVPTSTEPSAQITLEPSIVDGTTAPTKLVPTSFLSGTSLQALTKPGQTGVPLSNDVVEVTQTNVKANNTDVGTTQKGANQPVNTTSEETASSSSVLVASMVALTISTAFFATM
jgi:secreted trypsin-like serine protease